MKNYIVRKTNEEEQRRILKVFREYGSMIPDMIKTLDVVTVVEIPNEKICLTCVQDLYDDYDQTRKAEVHKLEWVLLGDDRDLLITCDGFECRNSEEICECENIRVQGENASILADEMLNEYFNYYFAQEKERKNLFRKYEINWRNLDAIKSIMMEDKEFWREKGYTIVEDFRFVKTTEEEQQRLWKCIKRYCCSLNDYQNAKVELALTNADRSILFTMGAFVSEWIKRCDEPSDYEYVVVKGDRAEWMLVWFEANGMIKAKRGDEIFEDDELLRMVDYYEKYHHAYESMA